MLFKDNIEDHENYTKLINILDSYGLSIEGHTETLLHMVRCSIIAKHFGETLGLSTKEITLIEHCALLHDLGKFTIDPCILYKTTKLTQEELTIVRSHINVMEFDMPLVIWQTIRYHHERPDSKGYLGVPYNEIPWYVRIVSLVDAYDVMSTVRCYKNNCLLQSAIREEIFNNLGKQFDCFLGDAFINMLDTGELGEGTNVRNGN